MQSNKDLEIKSVPVDQVQLQLAFAAFNEASEQLSGVYQELQHKVTQLTGELAIANGEDDTQRKISEFCYKESRTNAKSTAKISCLFFTYKARNIQPVQTSYKRTFKESG